MTNEELVEANKLKKEIKELDYFIGCAERRWTGKIIKKVDTYIFRANNYGGLDDVDYNMKYPIKERVLDVLRDYLEELKMQLEKI